MSIADRALGAVLASATGDALGAPYEFLPSVPDTTPIVWKAGPTFDQGEWTDDTAQALPILEQLALGADLCDPAVQGKIVRRWLDWAVDAKDIGIQTSRVFGYVHRQISPATPDAEVAAACIASARKVHTETGKSGGNGSLMRTGPVALGFLQPGDDAAERCAAAARAISGLTHFEQDTADACVLWSLAIRHVVLTGRLDLRAQLKYLPATQRGVWGERLDVAEALPAPRDVPGNNGWVVAALQAAYVALRNGERDEGGVKGTLECAVRCGDDTDTVAAIAGSLAGAVYGARDVPAEWVGELHGWPAGVKAAQIGEMVAKALEACKAEV